MTLKDGTTSKKLVYRYNDYKQGKSSTGALRQAFNTCRFIGFFFNYIISPHAGETLGSIAGACAGARRVRRPSATPPTSSRTPSSPGACLIQGEKFVINYVKKYYLVTVLLHLYFDNSNRHNQWAGLYGRVENDGFFSTTITNPGWLFIEQCSTFSWNTNTSENTG